MMKIKNYKSPALRFSDFGGEWEIKKLGSLLEFKNGINASKEQYGSGVRFINVLDILENDFITYDRILGCVNISSDLLEKYPVNYGDVLFQRSSETREEVGTASVYLDKNRTATFGGFIIRGRKIGEYDPVFLNLLLKTSLSRDQITTKSGGSTRYNVGQEVLSSVQLLFPTSAEQQKIASFFTAIDQKISQLKKKHQLLEQYKKGVMQKIFSQQIRFKDDDGREFPKWERKRLGEILYEHKTLNSKGKFQEVFSVAKQKGVVNQIEHLGRSFSAKDVSNYKVIYPNDVVYTKSPTSDFPFGIIKQNQMKRIGIVSPLYGVFRPVTADLGFLLHNYFLSWINTYNYLNPLVQKGAKNTMNINNKDFLNGAKISLPVSENEQTKIANFLSALDDKIAHTKKMVEHAEHWKKGLMQRMFV